MNNFTCRPASTFRKANNENLPDTSSRSLQSASYGKESVVVAVNAGREITKHALEWALTNVIQTGDHITLICVLHAEERGSRRLWNLTKLAKDCANPRTKLKKCRSSKETEEEAAESCSQSVQALHRLCDVKQVNMRVKCVSGASKGVVAMEAQSLSATWVVLDSGLKEEQVKLCLLRLGCNLVVVKKRYAKILRLNLRYSSERGKDALERAAGAIFVSESASIPTNDPVGGNRNKASSNHDSSIHGKSAYPAAEDGASSSSAEVRTCFTASSKGMSSSVSSSEWGASPSPFASRDLGNTCTNHKEENNAPEIDDSDVVSDDCLADAVSDNDSSNDESRGDITGSNALCVSTSRSSDIRALGSTERSPNPSDGQLSHQRRTEGEPFFIDPWMPYAKVRPSSADATPKTAAQIQGRISMPTTPLDSSKRLRDSSCLSVSMRKSGLSIHEVNPSQHFARWNLDPQQRILKHIRNSARMSMNAVQHFDPDKVTCLKTALTTHDLVDKFSKWGSDGLERGDDIAHKDGDLERTFSVRKAVSLSKHTPPGPPPLCSICQHKAPIFGKPPRRFAYAELELATGGFSQANFLAEGGFGSVHRGVLPDGQAVAVKQHKLASSQGDLEFCSEVEVLSCAQHRNVVMLIGYCIEDKRRLLVYEFICNGSLDTHLNGRDTECLEWLARQKIAVGAARGLRYLHEECRVGCIVHRDMRPNNILLTHDFEPMVGDFGLARWQPDGDVGVQTRVVGTFGFLAPEYAQSGQITDKADVYSFGVVLLELATGRKAVDLHRPKGQQCLTEWARPLLEETAVHYLIDPLLGGNYSEYEAYCMLHAASLCVQKDPQLRPRMSQVLWILEGNVVTDKSILPISCYGSKRKHDISGFGGSLSSRMLNDYAINRATARSSYTGSMAIDAPGRKASATLSADPLVGCHANGKLTYEALKATYIARAHTGKFLYEDS